MRTLTLRVPARWAASLVLVLSLAACGGGGGDGGSGGVTVEHELAVTVNGDGTGPVSGAGRVTSQPAGVDCTIAICRARFAAGTRVTLTAAATAGQRFTGWGGACSGTLPSCEVVLSADRSVNANFTTVSTVPRALVVNVVGSGTVSSQPAGIQCGATCSADFTDGTTVVLTATPAAGLSIAGWTGACAGSAGSCTVAMTESRTVSVTFADPQPAGWTAVQIASGPDDWAWADIFVEPVRTAIDESGQALAVWFELPAPGGTLRLVANRYTPGVGWGTPVEVAPAVAKRRYESPELVMDPTSGRALLAWLQQDGEGANRSLWSRTFEPTAGWGAVEAVQAFDAAASSIDLRVGLDAAGQATAVWRHDPDAAGPQPARILASRRAAGGSWGTPVSISAETDAAQPKLAVAANGSTVALWGGMGNGLWSSQAGHGGGWSAPVELVKYQRGARGAYLFDVALNASGEGLLAWYDFSAVGASTTFALKAKRFLQGAWQTADLAVDQPTAPDVNIRPVVAINAHGHSVIAWQPKDESLRAAVGLPGQAWAVAEVKPADALTTVVRSDYRLQLAIDGVGNALLAWTQSTNGTNPDLFINRYTPSGGWAGPTLHENYTGFDEIAAVPALAMNDRGQAMLAWLQSIHHPSTGSFNQRTVSRFYSSGR